MKLVQDKSCFFAMRNLNFASSSFDWVHDVSKSYDHHHRNEIVLFDQEEYFPSKMSHPYPTNFCNITHSSCFKKKTVDTFICSDSRSLLTAASRPLDVFLSLSVCNCLKIKAHGFVYVVESLFSFCILLSSLIHFYMKCASLILGLVSLQQITYAAAVSSKIPLLRSDGK